MIVNYCQWRNTARLTKHLRRSHASRTGEAEIVIIDNHSPAPSPARQLAGKGRFAASLSPKPRLRRAVNEGCELSSGDWVLLLNPDMSVPAGFLDDAETLVDQLAAESRVGIIGLDVRNADGSSQPSCGPLPTLSGTLARLFLPRSSP